MVFLFGFVVGVACVTVVAVAYYMLLAVYVEDRDGR